MRILTSVRRIGPPALLAAAAVVHPTAGAVGQVGGDPAEAVLATFRDRLGDPLGSGAVGGVTALVVADGTVVWAEGLGWSDAEQAIPAGPETVYPLGSLSSGIVRLLLLQLAERGFVRLDDPAVTYVPELRRLRAPPAYAASITLRHLANHRAGLVETPAIPYAVPAPSAEWEPWITSLIHDSPLYYVPGDGYGYSGLGLGILGLALARAAGQPLGDLARLLIFDPLGMEHSGLVLTPAMRARLATGHGELRDPAVLPGHGLARAGAGGPIVPSDGFFVTAEDLGRLLDALVGRSAYPLVTLGTLPALRSLQAREPGRGRPADGLRIETTPSGSRVIGRGRTAGGHESYFAVDAASGIGVLALRSHTTDAAELGPIVEEALTDLVAAASDGSAAVAGGGAAPDAVWRLADVDERPARHACPHLGVPRLGAAEPTPSFPVRVTLEFVLGTDGRAVPGSVWVIASDDARFHAVAVDWVLGCDFTPAHVDDRPVPVVLRQAVSFSGAER